MNVLFFGSIYGSFHDKTGVIYQIRLEYEHFFDFLNPLLFVVQKVRLRSGKHLGSLNFLQKNIFVTNKFYLSR